MKQFLSIFLLFSLCTVGTIYKQYRFNNQYYAVYRFENNNELTLPCGMKKEGCADTLRYDFEGNYFCY